MKNKIELKKAIIQSIIVITIITFILGLLEYLSYKSYTKNLNEKLRSTYFKSN